MSQDKTVTMLKLEIGGGRVRIEGEPMHSGWNLLIDYTELVKDNDDPRDHNHHEENRFKELNGVTHEQMAALVALSMGVNDKKLRALSAAVMARLPEAARWL